MVDPKPGTFLRCCHCAGPLSKEMETNDWTVSPFIRDSFSMIGSAVGGTTSAFYGFNHVMPIIQRRVKGPMWLHFLIVSTNQSTSLGTSRLFLSNQSASFDCRIFHIGQSQTNQLFSKSAPPVIVFSSACAGLAGGAIPALAQLASSSYHAMVPPSSLRPPPSQDDKIHKSRTSSTL